ncbi:MAG TPA: glycosyltransferase family 4 protein [Acetobacteraceae bacterium]|nr:glycosyltransferase family 4 protein [Acetobacteraceae bacterium]
MPESDVAAAARTGPLAVQLGLEWFADGVGGGASRVMADLMRTLPATGIAVRGAVAAPSGVAALTAGRVEAFAADGAPLGARLLGARRAVRRMLRAQRVAVVASHFALYAAPCLDLLGDVPLVVHFHGPWAAESRREGARRAAVTAKAALERLVYRRAARVIVLSRAFADLAQRSYGISPERLRIIPASVDIGRFAVPTPPAEARARLGWPVGRPLVLAVRRLAARMGLDNLLAAMPEIVRREPSVLLLIAGRGPQEQALRSQVERLGLTGHVRFLGFVPDELLPLAYRAADLHVVPSVDLEGFGLVAAEALAAGTPALVTPIGGLPEVVADLSPGLVLRSSTPADIAAGIGDVLAGTLALPDRAACAAYAARRFPPDRMAAAVASVYREVCRG